jgi:butyrate kinase
LPHDDYRILAINPGSTSTKLAVYLNDSAQRVRNIRHTDEEMARFRGKPILDQQDFRLQQIKRELEQAGCKIASLHAVAGRGGLLPPLPSGTYVVDEEMLEELRMTRRGEHASNLGAVLAWAIAKEVGVNAYIVDPVSVDEWQDCARISGLEPIARTCLLHALNTKAVAKRYARDRGTAYEALRLIVVHMGSGISVSAHRDGRIIDNNTGEDGPFAADRAGSLPVQQLVRLCYSGKYTEKEADRLVFGEGGFCSYLGTKDLKEVERRIDAGDAKAAAIFEAMVYQIGKEMGAMAAVLKGRVDAVLFTGGMAHSEKLVSQLREYASWIAPIHLYPGEDELQSLAEGVLRVLRGQEQPRHIHHKEVPA